MKFFAMVCIFVVQTYSPPGLLSFPESLYVQFEEDKM